MCKKRTKKKNLKKGPGTVALQINQKIFIARRECPFPSQAGPDYTGNAQAPILVKVPHKIERFEVCKFVSTTLLVINVHF